MLQNILYNVDGQSGIIEVIFQNKNPDKKIFEYNYTFKKKNNNTIKYYYNKKTISIKKLSYYIQNTMGTDSELFIRIFINDETLTKTTLTENPILVKKVITIGAKKIGYLMYNGFYADFDLQLNTAFGDFKTQGITDLVLEQYCEQIYRL